MSGSRTAAGGSLVLLTIAVFISFAGLAPSVHGAKTYVSLNGGFYIEYPDDWYQVDYLTFEAYLVEMGAEVSSFDYEAVFAQDRPGMFDQHAYLILAVDTIGALTEQQRDSVLQDMNTMFDEDIQYAPTGSSIAALKTGEPVYDRETQTVSVLNDIVDAGQVVKKNVYVMKFYDRGIANFFFYAPDSVYAEVQPVFQEIVSSFSTENVRERLKEENVRLADADRVTGNDGAPTFMALLPYIVLILAILFIVVRFISRKKKAKQ
jgi:hypothetical protein